MDFRQDVAIDWLPLWASQFEHVPTGYRFALPVVEPLPGRHYMRNSHTTSTFHITDECWYEVRGSPPVRNSDVAHGYCCERGTGPTIRG